MPKKSKLEKAREPIIEFFNGIGSKVYRRSDLQNILNLRCDEWHIRKDISVEKFIKYVSNALPLQKIQLSFRNRIETRYIYQKCSIFEIAQSIKTAGYFSHRTAAEINGLLGTDINIYINFEQSKKSQSSGEMTQETINRAFQNKPRISNNKAKYNNYTIWLLNGKNTGCY
jgi:hypothetical protein